MTATSTGLLQIAHFADLTRWSVHDAAFGKVKSRFPLVPLSRILKRSLEPIDVKDDRLYKRITVRLYGQGVLQRDEVPGKEIGTKRQFVAHAGQLIISRIDARNGAFGLVPDSLENGIVTNDFWLFDVHDALPEYVMLVLSSDPFQKYWQTQSSGTTNRQRVNGNDLFSSLIPLPTVAEQFRIVDSHRLTSEKAEWFRSEAFRVKQSIDDTICELLEVSPSKANTTACIHGLSFVEYSCCDNWSVEYLLNRKNCDFLGASKYPVVKAKDFICDFQYGLSEKASNDNSGVPILRMNNIQNSSIDISDLKYLQADIKSIDKYILHQGDLLINRTNSKELVGKTAVFSLPGTYVFASYLIRVVIDQKIADVQYVNHLFASKIIRSQINLISRQVLGQANINVSELQSLRFPLPPLAEQTRIVTKIESIIQKSNTLLKNAEELKHIANQQFTESVFNEA